MFADRESFQQPTPEVENAPKLKVQIPEVGAVPPVYNPKAAEYDQLAHDPVAQKEFRQAELLNLAEQINAIPHESFVEERDQEKERLQLLYETISRLFGVDISAVANTRIQQINTVMESTLLLLQSMFDEDQKNDETASEGDKPKLRTFFESRKEGGGFQFNANGVIEIEGFKAIFSVLKRTVSDKEGSFEIDYPTYSLPREIFVSWQAWHEAEFPNIAFTENPLIKVAQRLMSRRVHDWIHAAVLYDSKSLTNAFQKWSNDSFFVKHILDDPGMINYELLANHLHFATWQEIIKQEPLVKQELLSDVKTFSTLVEQWQSWQAAQETSEGEADRMATFISYLGVRSTFDYIPYHDQELQAVMEQHPVINRAASLLPEKTRQFLDEIYKPDQMIPFRMASDQRLTIIAILQEYVSGLIEEAHAYRQASLIEALFKDRPMEGERPLTQALLDLPAQWQEQLKGLRVDQVDPRIFRRLSGLLQEYRRQYETPVVEALINLTEIDADGYFYIKLDQTDFDFSQAETVNHQKSALMFQIPYDQPKAIELSLNRVNTLITSQRGAQVSAQPGDIILVNIQNENLSQELLARSTDSRGQINVESLLQDMYQLSANGISQLQDIYVYDPQKVAATFDLSADAVTETEGKMQVKPGFYDTKRNQRKAYQTGPISLNAPNHDPAQQRRILSGAVVENHIKSNDSMDIFPVHEGSFNRFYKPADRKSLPTFKLTQQFYDRLFGASTNNNELVSQFSHLLPTLMKDFEEANNISAYGFRGKPMPVTNQELRLEKPDKRPVSLAKNIGLGIRNLFIPR